MCDDVECIVMVMVELVLGWIFCVLCGDYV